MLEAGKPGSPMVAGSLEACRMHALDFELLDAGEVTRRFPAVRLPRDYSAIWQPEGGILRSQVGNRLHLGLAEAAGAAVAAGTRVMALEESGKGVRVVVDGQSIVAGSVASAGAWIGDLVPGLESHLSIARIVLPGMNRDSRKLGSQGSKPVSPQG
jgi:sarcosine oxidase